MSNSRLLDNRGVGKGVAPEFLVDPKLLDITSPSGERGGMIFGSGPQGEPVTVSVLRNAPTRMAMVGGLYLARQIALRAAATGATVVIATGRPRAWAPVIQATGANPEDRNSPVQLRRLSPVELPRPSEDSPVLVLHDGGHVPQELFPPRSPWQTTMYVLPYLHPQASSTIVNSELVLFQRMPIQQAQQVCQTMRRPPQLAQQLTTLKDDQVIAAGFNLWMPLRLVTNPAEQQILGAVRRGD
ncbi:hypothetical protein [Actinosynnema sp.]|uniref:hypothetical protein n=1 Tax=Actinosynnema sp. TaxID=1872144 RepID=UPI003F855D4A